MHRSTLATGISTGALPGPLLGLLAGSLVLACSGPPKQPACEACAPWQAPPVGVAPSASTSASVAVPAHPPAPTPKPSPYTLEQLLDVKRAVAPRALDDERMLFLSDVTGTYQLAKLGEGGKTQTITAFPDRVSSYRVAPGGKRLVFLKDTGGDENDQIFALPLDGGDAVALTASPKVKHTLPCFDPTGKKLAFTSNARNGKDMDLYVEAFTGAAPKSLDRKPLLELAGNYAVTDFRGNQVLVVEARSNVDQDVWVLDVATKKRTLLTKHVGDERWESPRFSRDGKVVFALSDRGREFVSLFAVDVATQKSEVIVAEDHDLATLALPRWDGAPPKGPKGKPAFEDLLVYGVNVDGTESLAILELDDKRHELRRMTPKLKGVIGALDVAASGKAAFVAIESAVSPPEIHRIDLRTGETTKKTSSDHKGVDEAALYKEQSLSCTSFDGKKIQYFFYGQTAPGRWPVVVNVHGGPEAQAQPGFSAITQYLALAGYHVAQPNVRGSLGFGKSFAHLDDKEKREDSVKDLSAIGKCLTERADVDAYRIALYGGSYGGYMVLAGLTLFPEQWAAGVDVVGIANFRTFLEQTAPYRRALREAEYGSLEKDGPLLDAISPIHKVDKIKAPLMVIHGTRDPRVPIGEAVQITKALEKRGLPVQLLTFDDEGHGLSKLKNRLVAFPAMIAFLEQHVRLRK